MSIINNYQLILIMKNNIYVTFINIITNNIGN